MTQPKIGKKKSDEPLTSCAGPYDVNYSQVKMRSTAVAIRPEQTVFRKDKWGKNHQNQGVKQKQTFLRDGMGQEFDLAFRRAVDFTRMRERLPLIKVVLYSKEDSVDAEQQNLDAYLKRLKRPSSKIRNGRIRLLDRCPHSQPIQNS